MIKEVWSASHSAESNCRKKLKTGTSDRRQGILCMRKEVLFLRFRRMLSGIFLTSAEADLSEKAIPNLFEILMTNKVNVAIMNGNGGFA